MSEVQRRRQQSRGDESQCQRQTRYCERAVKRERAQRGKQADPDQQSIADAGKGRERNDGRSRMHIDPDIAVIAADL
jgi:hypothetical protein